jgi:hypothetical protein
MDPGTRYGSLLPAGLREEPLITVPRELPELELQAHWFAGDFGCEFQTSAGEAVRIVQFGVWNREAGPDFSEAAISLNGGEPQRGHIEIDPDARDWEHHGHATNSAYESVVLHVFTRRGPSEFFTRTARHRNVPQVLLDLTCLDGASVDPQPAAREGRCAAPLRALSEEKVREILLGAAQFRLRRKAAALARLAELHGTDEALYQALATTLGYKNNKLPFTLLAQRLPLKILRRRDAAALLFGMSGFLPTTELAGFDAPTRSYLRGLWDRWWPRRAEFERFALAPAHWHLAGLRPANHPQRRLAALAQIVAHWPQVRSLAKRCDPTAIRKFFAELSDEYWDTHYTVRSKTAARPMALVGESRVTEMLTNVFFPLAISRDEARWHDFTKLPASLSNQRIEVAAQRLFGAREVKQPLIRQAATQQGLLQVYEDFCLRDASDCERCRFPSQCVRW